MPPMPAYQRPRGTRDLLPDEAAAMDTLQAVVQARALRYGYPRLSTPIIDFANGLFAEVGLTAFELEINTIGDEPCQAKLKTALGDYFGKHRDSLSPQSQRRLDTNVLRILDSKEPQDREIIAGAPKLSDVLCEED